MPEQRLDIPQPPKEIFEHGLTKISNITREHPPTYILEKIEYPESGGIFVYLKDVLYPTKGFPTIEAIEANNIAKRYFMNQITFFSKLKLFIAIFLLLPYKQKINLAQHWLRNYGMFCKPILLPYYMKDSYYMDMTKQLRIFTSTFMSALGFHEHWCADFSKIFHHMIEFDTAYRYRIEDIMSETSKEKLLNNSRKEVQRLLAIYLAREPNLTLKNKFKYIASALALLLWHPRIKKAFKKAVQATDISKLGLDLADRYHVMPLGGYDFFGLSADLRRPTYMAMHNGKPPEPIYFEVIE